MKAKHSDLVDELEIALTPIIEKHMKKKGLDIEDIVYCCCFEAEEIALKIKRRSRTETKPKNIMEAAMDELFS